MERLKPQRPESEALLVVIRVQQTVHGVLGWKPWPRVLGYKLQV